MFIRRWMPLDACAAETSMRMKVVTVLEPAKDDGLKDLIDQRRWFLRSGRVFNEGGFLLGDFTE